MAAEAGQGCKILLSTTSYFPYQLIGANPDYATVESLRGQVIAGGQGAASAPQVFAKAVLLQEGMEPGTDASIMSMLSSGYLPAMAKGEIQAAVSTNPWAEKLMLDNGGVVIVDGSDEDAMEALMGSRTYELFMIFTSDTYLEENPETVQKAVRAMARALAWMDSATPEEIAKNMEPLFEGRYDELLYSAQVDKETGLLNPTGYHTETGFSAAMDLTKLSGQLTRDVSPEEIYDESFLTTAWESLS